MFSAPMISSSLTFQLEGYNMNGLDWSFSSDVLYQIDNMYADYGSEWVAYYEDSYESVEFVGEYLNDGETIVVALQ